MADTTNHKTESAAASMPVAVSSASSLDTLTKTSTTMAQHEQYTNERKDSEDLSVKPASHPSTANATATLSSTTEGTSVPATTKMMTTSVAALPSIASSSYSTIEPVASTSMSSHVSPAAVSQAPRPNITASILPSMILPPSQIALMQADSTGQSFSTNNSIPEFLYQLTKMLTDDNKEVIEWSKGMIEVHSPHRLEKEVLQKYFRHSKFASFQRQLNYFGFRKIAGKGKMAPCSYVNESATGDLGSILFIKRKTTPAGASKDKSSKKREAASSSTLPAKRPAEPIKPTSTTTTGVNPVLAEILHRSAAPVGATVTQPKVPVAAASGSGTGQQIALAQAAVGRGVRHSFARSSQPASGGVTAGAAAAAAVAATSASTTDDKQPALTKESREDMAADAPSSSTAVVHDSLSQLANNYRNSLNEHEADDTVEGAAPTPLAQLSSGPHSASDDDLLMGFLSRDTSLVDLAMIPEIETEGNQTSDSNTKPSESSAGLSFIDFPNPEVYPPASQPGADSSESQG